MPGAKSQRLITIEAHVSDEFTPDRLDLTVAYRGTHETKEECTSHYREDLVVVQTALEKAGIPPEDIKHGAFRVFPNVAQLYELRPDGRYYSAVEKIEGYRYESNTYVFMDSAEEAYGVLWHTLREIDGDFSYRIEHSLKDRDAAQSSLLEQAVRQAEMRAGAIASATGIELGGVENIQHSFSYEALIPRMVTRSEVSAFRAGAHDSAETELSPSYNPPGIHTSCSITISWSIE